MRERNADYPNLESTVLEETFNILKSKIKNKDWYEASMAINALDSLNQCTNDIFEMIFEVFDLLMDYDHNQNEANLKQCLDLAKSLVCKDIEINRKNRFNNNLLHHVVAAGNRDFTLLLLNHAASVTIRNGKGWTPVSIARRCQYWDIVTLLAHKISEDDLKIHHMQTTLNRALYHALIAQAPTSVYALLKAGADVDYFHKKSNQYCFHLAVKLNDVISARAFIICKVNLKLTTPENLTPLELAKELKFDEIANAIETSVEIRAPHKPSSTGKIPFFSFKPRFGSLLSRSSHSSDSDLNPGSMDSVVSAL